MLNDMYKSIMDSEVNSLRKLPKMVRFQIMASLAYMWSVVFCIWAGLVSYAGFSIAAHTVLLIGEKRPDDGLQSIVQGPQRRLHPLTMFGALKPPSTPPTV
jgi:hypothetical protein